MRCQICDVKTSNDEVATISVHTVAATFQLKVAATLLLEVAPSFIAAPWRAIGYYPVSRMYIYWLHRYRRVPMTAKCRMFTSACHIQFCFYLLVQSSIHRWINMIHYYSSILTILVHFQRKFSSFYSSISFSLELKLVFQI